jgi:TetR/AcrR family transcriptional regulator, tetracycline repressor protein
MSAEAAARVPRKSLGRPQGGGSVTREQIAQVALEQIDSVGLNGFSLRDVARTLGVYPATIYWHIASKDALLAEVASLVMDQVTPPRGRGSWQDWLKDLFKRYRKAIRRHPNVAQLIGAQLVSNASLKTELIEGVLVALLEAGATETNLVQAYNCVVNTMVSFMTMELAPLPTDDPDAWAAELEERVQTIRPLDHPTLVRYLPLLANRAFIVRWQNGTAVPLDSSFEANIQIFLSGLEVFLAA